MSLTDPDAHPLVAERSPWLRGSLNVPGDPSISRLALILGTMARGETVIEGLRETPGVLAIADALQMLGARIDKRSGGWHVMGLGAGGFLEPQAEFQFGGAANSLDLAMGLIGIYDFPSRFIGNAWLSRQPLRHMFDPLALLGIEVLDGSLDGLPLTLRGPRLPVPPVFEVPAGALHLKDVMLLAALAIPGTTEITECENAPDHAERLLLGFGAHVERSTDSQGRRTVALNGLPALRAQRIVVPADPTLAGFAVVAALIVPGSEVVIEGVSANPTRDALLMTLREMGAEIGSQNPRSAGGEGRVDLHVRHSPLRGIVIPAADAASTAAEYPALAVAASFAVGQTRLQGLQQLPVGTRYRLQLMAEGLQASGVACRLDDDSLEITGTGSVRGGVQVAVSADAWTALALLVLGLAAEDAVTLDDGGALGSCFPGFVSGLESIGASFASPSGIFERLEVSG